MPIRRYILLITLFYTVLPCVGQSDMAAMYETAYNHLDSIIKSEAHSDPEMLASNCSKHIKVIENGKTRDASFHFKPDLQVAHRFIKLNSQFPYGNFSTLHYNLSKACQLDLRMGIGKCEQVKHMFDSLNSYWEDYKMLPEDTIIKQLSYLPSTRKDGYQVFFSDIYKNTLAAEIKSFCLPYNEDDWFGSSTSFYFVFDETGKIKSVYSEVIKIYN